MALTFAVGTGRCGSTMTARILHEHPEVLCVSEFFVHLTMHRDEFPTEHLDGQQLWQVLSASDFVLDSFIAAGMAAPELCYPYGKGRFDPATGVPMICHITLPMLSDDPDGLFDAMAAEVVTWPPRATADHYRALFEWLAARLDRKVMVERSGGSIRLVPMLHKEFPDARFVHVYRDGPDCALSMSRHPMFRLIGLATMAAEAAGLSGWQEAMALGPEAVPEEYLGLLFPPFDAQRFTTHEIPLPFFGQAWSMLICEGVAALRELPADMWTGLRYEDLLADPDTELGRLGEFIGAPATPQWLRDAKAFINPRRAGQAARLDPGTLAALREACAPGTEALAELAAR